MIGEIFLEPFHGLQQTFFGWVAAHIMWSVMAQLLRKIEIRELTPASIPFRVIYLSGHHVFEYCNPKLFDSRDGIFFGSARSPFLLEWVDDSVNQLFKSVKDFSSLWLTEIFDLFQPKESFTHTINASGQIGIRSRTP